MVEFTLKIRRYGDSLVVVIPRQIAKDFDIREGDVVRVMKEERKGGKR